MAETTEPGTGAKLAGGCACGRVRYRAARRPFQSSYCHCADCRRATGAPVSVMVGFAAEAVAFERAPSERASSAHALRSFCGACGTPIGYRDVRLPGELYLLAGTLDEPGAAPPTCHAWLEEAVGWLRIADELPRYSRFSRPRDGSDPEPS